MNKTSKSITTSKVSAVLIVKNESKMLARCLESLKGKVDEIVVCDTGSTDNTVEIAKQYTDNIQHFEWCDDFSKARNYAKKFAKHEWIISIDADEVLSCEYHVGMYLHKKFNAVMVTLQNETKEDSAESVRIFKKCYNWSGKIHEFVDVTKKIASSDIKIIFGRSPTHDEDPMRNLRILANEYKKGDYSERTVYYFGRELLAFGYYEEAKEAFIEYVQKSTFLSEKADALLMLACIEASKGNNELSISYALNCIGLNPDNEIPYLLIGFITKEKKWNEHAVICRNTGVLSKYDFEFIKSLAFPEKT